MNEWLLANAESIQWLANAFLMLSAVLVTISIRMCLSIYPFIGFLVAHILWLVMAVHIDIQPLAWQNGFFIILDSYAILIRTQWYINRRK